MIQVEVFWVVTPCSVVVGYQRFGVPSCLHLQGEDGSSMASQPRRPQLDTICLIVVCFIAIYTRNYNPWRKSCVYRQLNKGNV